MILDLTISNFRSVQSPQTISFEAVRDNRLLGDKVVEVDEKLNVIKTCAIIGPNGAGKSTFIRALEALKAIVTLSCGDGMSGSVILPAQRSPYTEEKGQPAQIIMTILLGQDEETGKTLTGRYMLAATREKVFEESYYLFLSDVPVK